MDDLSERIMHKCMNVARNHGGSPSKESSTTVQCIAKDPRIWKYENNTGHTFAIGHRSGEIRWQESDGDERARMMAGVSIVRHRSV